MRSVVRFQVYEAFRFSFKRSKRGTRETHLRVEDALVDVVREHGASAKDARIGRAHHGGADGS